MKVTWMWNVIDGAVNVVALCLLSLWFGWEAAAIGFGLIIWNFLDGLMRR